MYRLLHFLERETLGNISLIRLNIPKMIVSDYWEVSRVEDYGSETPSLKLYIKNHPVFVSQETTFFYFVRNGMTLNFF